jgi:PAS domain S-box-containing protein
MLRKIADFPLHNERDVKAAAQRARLLGTLVDLQDSRRKAFGKAVRELAGNAIQHSGAGRIEFQIDSTHEAPFVEAVVTDSAQGHRDVNITLAQTDGPDSGLRRAQAAVDRLALTADTDTKSLRAAMAISTDVAAVDETDLADWAGILRTRRIESGLGGIQRRSREIAEQLAGAQRQRQKLEAELQQSRSMNEALTLLSLVASKTDNAVVIMDRSGLITWVNDAFIRMTGFSVQAAASARLDKLLSGPDTNRESLKEMDQAFKLGHGVSEEFLQYRREGTSSWITLNLTPIHNDQGIVTRWIGIGSDITKRKEAEQALKSAKEAAETASQLKGEFLANISHEIRTPMNAIIGMTDLTLATALDADQREYLSTVKQSAESLLDLLNDVLDLSKIEAGRLDIQQAPMDLHAVIQDTLKPLAFIATQKGLQFDVSISTEVPCLIVGDALRLRQVLVNLVGNAIKFTSRGHVEVTVQKQWQADGEAGLEFTIADTGIGIPPDKLSRIFEAFSQADSTITREFGGTGLGLAITSELLSLMKGRVWVQSEPGRGSQFHFTLRCRLPGPLETQTFNRQKNLADSTDTPDPFAAEQRPLKILVADDHPANRRLMASILEKRGHRLSFATNGHEVLKHFRAEGFDIVLMDVQMPDMDGYQATAAIREIETETHSHVPIIAVTAHGMQGSREVCLASGMDAYLSKPVTAAALITLIDSLRDNEVNVSATSTTSTGYVALDETPHTDTAETCPESSVADPPAAASPTSAFSAALKRLDNDEELLREQMQFFLNDGPELLTMLQTAVTNGDGPGQQIAAHRLKNLCATFDDEETASICNHLETIGAAGAPADPALLDNLQTRLSDLLTSVRQYCQT